MASAAGLGVLIVAPMDPDDMPIGGIASFIRGFVKYAPRDLSIGLVGTSDSARAGTWRRAALEGREILHLPVTRSRRFGATPLSVTFTLGLLRHRRSVPIDPVLQVHRPATALPLLARRGPKVQIVHLAIADLTGGGSESRWRRLPWLLRLTEGFAYRRMDRVYVVNAAAAETYRREFAAIADRFTFIPNWVDDGVFVEPEERVRDEIRRDTRTDLGLGEAAVLILFAGRLELQKDPQLAVRAFAELRRAVADDLHLLVAGGGTMRPALESEASRLGVRDAVHLTGALDRSTLARLMAAADVFLLTSNAEAGPTIGVEALATGLPVVTTRVGTISEIVAGSDAGAVVEGRTAEAVAAAIRNVLRRDRAGLRAACRAAVEPYRAAAILPRLYEDLRALRDSGSIEGRR